MMDGFVMITLGCILILLSSVIKKQDKEIKDIDKIKKEEYVRGYNDGRNDLIKESLNEDSLNE